MFELFAQKFSSLFERLTGQSQLTDAHLADAVDNMRQTLLDADVPYEVVTAFCEQVRADVVGKKLLKGLKPAEQFMQVMHECLKNFLGGDVQSTQFAFQIPSVVLMMGLQGSGKTTTIGKLAHYVQAQAQARGKQRSILVGSIDFYRPAALEQLKLLAERTGVTYFHPTTTDPVAAAQQIYTQFKQGGYDLLFLDTAGRLHVDEALLNELKAVEKLINPRYKVLVLDAMTGQESLSVARAFDQAVGFTMAILTKIDSQSRTGAAFAFKYALKKPIQFVGAGERMEDLEQFYPDRMAQRMLGAGDLMTLVERAQVHMKVDAAEQEKRILSGRITLDDFAEQLGMMSQLGSLSQIAQYIPGVAAAQITPDKMQQAEKQLKQFKAILGSMTVKERKQPHVLDLSRKKRIAKGAGVVSQDVDLMLGRFEESQQFVKLLKKFGKFNTMFK